MQSPLDSPNAEFLYLYGRANLLTGNTDEASKAFDAAISKADAKTGFISIYDLRVQPLVSFDGSFLSDWLGVF